MSRPAEPRKGGFWSRLAALTVKEMRQLLRDTSNLAIGIALPAVLILLFGYGISLDLENAQIAVVLEDTSPTVADVLSGLRLSPYISLATVHSMKDAEALMRERKVQAILRVPGDFTGRLTAGHATLQLIVHGADAATARVVQVYVSRALAQWSVRRADSEGGRAAAVGSIPSAAPE